MITDTFNEPPKVTIEGPASLYRLQPGIFTAVVADDDHEGVAYEWRESANCPNDLASATALARGIAARGNLVTFNGFARDVAGPACVFVVVTDNEGARGFAAKDVTIKQHVLVIRGPDGVSAQQDATFTATFTDEPEATARAQFAWATDMGGACDAARTKAIAQTRAPDRATWSSKAPRRPFCVAVAAEDEFGAVTTATLQINVTDATPAIRVVESTLNPKAVGLFTMVHLSALDSDDQIAVAAGEQYKWAVTTPAGLKLDPEQLHCPPPAMRDSEICFPASLAGTYRVELAVTIEGLSMTAVPLDLVVADYPPCIRVTDPSFGTTGRIRSDYDQERTFRVVEVQDDADPLPPVSRPNEGEFTWLVKRKGQEDFGRRVNATFSSFTLSAREFQLGDEVQVRVEYRDRLDRLRPREPDPSSSRCATTDARCELVANSGCYQWITWTVVYF